MAHETQNVLFKAWSKTRCSKGTPLPCSIHAIVLIYINHYISINVFVYKFFNRFIVVKVFHYIYLV